MKLVLRLVETGIDGSSRSVDVLEIVGRSDPGDIAALGVTLSQGRQLLALIQQAVVAAQCRELATRRPSCARPCVRSRTTARVRSPPRSVRSPSACPASAVPAAARWRPLATALPIDA